MNTTQTTATYECPKCSGTGRIQAFSHVSTGTCFACGGKGTWQGRPVRAYVPGQVAVGAAADAARQAFRAALRSADRDAVIGGFITAQNFGLHRECALVLVDGRWPYLAEYACNATEQERRKIVQGD